MGQIVTYNAAGEIIATDNVPDNFKPRLLTKTQFMDHAIAQLGSVDRFVDVIEGCQNHNNKTLRYAYKRYEAAITLDKTQATPLFDAMRAANHITQTERDNIVNNWPVG